MTVANMNPKIRPNPNQTDPNYYYYYIHLTAFFPGQPG